MKINQKEIKKDYKKFMEKRNKEITSLLLKGEPVGDIAKRFGISKESVNYIKIKNNIKVKPVRKSSCKGEKISNMHLYLGNVIQVYRIERGITIRDLSLDVKISYRRLAEIERGTYDFTLQELNQISNKLGIKLDIHLSGDENAGELQPENVSISPLGFSHISGEIT